jgi:thymidine kinase
MSDIKIYELLDAEDYKILSEVLAAKVIKLNATIIEQADKIKEMQALCKECADYLDTNIYAMIHNDSYLHRDLRKKAGDL